MPPKLYKAAEVCEVAQLQSYVLRSWEKEFPRIGIQKSSESPRLYRQSDLDQVLRIKQLVFGEGLTLAGARRRIEEEAPPAVTPDSEVEEVLEALASDARTRIAHVRDGLRSILHVLSNAPGTVVLVNDEFPLPPARQSLSRAAVPAKRALASRPKPRVVAKASGNRKAAKGKRSRANA
jgi:DNA-binding transcriptional MerR regulator